MGNQCTLETPKPSFEKSGIIQFEEQLPIFKGNFNFQKQSSYNKIQSAARQFCLSNQINRVYIPIISRLLAYNHHHYFAAFKTIPLELRLKFVESLVQLEVQLMDSLYNHLISRQNRKMNPFKTISSVSLFQVPPALKYSHLKSEDILSSEESGLRLLRQRKIAVMIMISGSQQSCSLTNRAFEVLPSKTHPTRLQNMLSKLHKNIIQSNSYVASTADTDSNQSGNLDIASQPIIIACNTMNEKAIHDFFKSNKWFGFDQKCVKIIAIRNLPILDAGGKFCLSFQRKTLVHPQGSAKCLELLLDHNTHLRGFLKYHKVQYLHVLGCQNQLECPGDPFLVGVASRFSRNMVARCMTPQQSYQKRMRYVRSQSRLHLLDMKQLYFLNDSNLLRNAPVALNSIVFQFAWLLDLIDDYELQITLSKRYHPKEIYCNYYDFVNGKPLINSQCFVFQKDYRDYIFASNKAQLIEYQRQDQSIYKNVHTIVEVPRKILLINQT